MTKFEKVSSIMSLIKLVSVVALALVVAVIFGIYQGQKNAKLNKIDEIASMKLAHGWKPEKACLFLNHLELKPKGYLPLDNSKQEWRCSAGVNMPFSKGSSNVHYKVDGVEDKATSISLIVSYQDDKHTVKNNAEQNREIAMFKNVFSGMSADLIVMSTAKLLTNDEMVKMESIKLDEKHHFSTDLFNIDLHSYQVKKGTFALKLQIQGKSAVPEKIVGSIQK